MKPSSPIQPAAADHSFFGHPRGLATLFFTEMWERFSYYGMRALLILFMTAAVAQGGMGLDARTAAAIYGLYTAAVYLLALPGGWLADRLWGRQRAVMVGGVLIAAGHFTLALQSNNTFFAGLLLIVLGTGLLKPNISTLVGELYTDEDDRRDAAFSIFYMGINVGSFLAPLVCGYLGEKVGWHWGFAAAGVGMVLGLIQYAFGRRHLDGVGTATTLKSEPERRRAYGYLLLASLPVAGLLVAVAIGVVPVNVLALANATVFMIGGLAAAFFLYLWVAGGLDHGEKRRLGVVAVLFVFSTLFWAGFEQGGSSLSLFARDMTERVIFGWEMPASWLQFVNAAYVIVLAPVFAALWVWLGRRQPSVPMKFAYGLLLVAAGFGILTIGARLAADGGKVGLSWLVMVYLFHTCGELCLSPVGLSTVTKLAPERYASQMMGVWFISISLGNLLAGLVAGKVETMAMSEVFFQVCVVTFVGGLLLALMAKTIKGWMRD